MRLSEDEQDLLDERKYRESVQEEVDSISDEAAFALYQAAKVALLRGNLDAVAEHALRAAVTKAEEY